MLKQVEIRIETNLKQVQNTESFMFHPPPKFGLPNLVKLFFCLIFVCLTIYAEKLPTRIYTVAEGLPRDVINCVTQDSRGFIWFCTPEDLSRFDGYEFKNYPKEFGLPSRTVTEFLETRNSNIWFGSYLSRLMRYKGGKFSLFTRKTDCSNDFDAFGL